MPLCVDEGVLDNVKAHFLAGENIIISLFEQERPFKLLNLYIGI